MSSGRYQFERMNLESDVFLAGIEGEYKVSEKLIGERCSDSNQRIAESLYLLKSYSRLLCYCAPSREAAPASWQRRKLWWLGETACVLH